MSTTPQPMQPEHAPATPSYESYGGNAPENYERYFVPAIGAPVAAGLMEHAALRPGERVLDVACGTGIATRMAAERVGPDGQVAGLDINPGMLAVARSVAPPEAGIEWHQASADAMPLPDDAYDVVLCQMGLQFFPDKPSALREMRRVLAPGGRLVTKLPGPTPPAFQLFADALARHVAPEVAGFAQGVFSLHDPEEIGALLDEAGFRDVSVEVGRRTLRLPPPADFLWQYVHSTPMAEPVGRLDQERRTAFERDVVSGWEPFTEDGTLVVEVDVATATGWN